MKIVFSKDAPNPIGPYSQGIEFNGLLFLSGQIAIDPKTNEFLGKDIETQTEQVIKNIAAVLESQKLKLENVIKTTCFLTDMADFSKFNEVYGKYFTSKPARSTVAVKELPASALIEIEVIAGNSNR